MYWMLCVVVNEIKKEKGREKHKRKKKGRKESKPMLYCWWWCREKKACWVNENFVTSTDMLIIINTHTGSWSPLTHSKNEQQGKERERERIRSKKSFYCGTKYIPVQREIWELCNISYKSFFKNIHACLLSIHAYFLLDILQSRW